VFYLLNNKNRLSCQFYQRIPVHPEFNMYIILYTKGKG